MKILVNKILDSQDGMGKIQLPTIFRMSIIDNISETDFGIMSDVAMLDTGRIISVVDSVAPNTVLETYYRGMIIHELARDVHDQSNSRRVPDIKH